MIVERFPTATSFLATAEPFLLQHEIESNVIFGIARAKAREPEQSGMPPYFAAVREGAEMLVCAFRTIPQKLGITIARRPEALALLAADVADACNDVPMIFGPEPGIGEFAAMLAAATNRRSELGMRQRLHDLREVAPLERLPAGSLRAAREEELELMASWKASFLSEVHDEGDTQRMARESIAAGRLFVWDDGAPRSMAAWTGGTPNGGRINFVYTPPELRGRGYATACVAALSRLMLERGSAYCCLYTDLANPISNAIYYRIGYRPVLDAAMYRLVD